MACAEVPETFRPHTFYLSDWLVRRGCAGRMGGAGWRLGLAAPDTPSVLAGTCWHMVAPGHDPHTHHLHTPPPHSPSTQDGANPAAVDLAHTVGALLPAPVRQAIAAFHFTCLPMQLHAVRGPAAGCAVLASARCCRGRLRGGRRAPVRLAVLASCAGPQPTLLPSSPTHTFHRLTQVALAMFASLIAPFGGFFASGFKRGWAGGAGREGGERGRLRSSAEQLPCA